MKGIFLSMSQSHDVNHEIHHVQHPPTYMPTQNSHNRNNPINSLNDNHNVMLSEEVCQIW